MTDRVPADQIEGIVGAPRHPTHHIGRLTRGTVYILHPYTCLGTTPDLRTCPYSYALDRGIDPDEWDLDVWSYLRLEGPDLRTDDYDDNTCPDCDPDNDYCPRHREQATIVNDAYEQPLIDHALPDTVTIPKPRILTGPDHLTVDEATTTYLRDAARRVRKNGYWGSGVTALVADTLDSVASAVESDNPHPEPGGPDASP